MVLVLHVFIALISIIQATELLFRPMQKKFYTTYGLIGLTFGTGTLLVIQNNVHLLRACVSGLLYLGVVSSIVYGAHKKFAADTIRLRK